ncbi:MAG: ribonuclease Z [Candidatus Rokuibacteriota bacterium]|nr:MAG: ribonuclease Z [Candidatus Rokubacteria bacterium]
MDLDIVFLGTSGSMPTAQRAPTATLVRRGGERLLFDCAEGTQRQLLASTVGLVELSEVFLTHYHADHYLGLPGMLKTFALRGRELPITVYGPPGLAGLFAALRRIFGRLTYEYELVELRSGDRLVRDAYRIETFAVAHGVNGIGYSIVEDERPGRFDVTEAEALGVPIGPERGALQAGEAVTLADGTLVRPEQVLGPPRPGRKLTLSGDTAPSPDVVEAARSADVLVHEATFMDEERERARETLHSTALDAAAVAREADVAMLCLTHLSNRYFGPEVAREARSVFAETVVPRDFDIIDLRYQERGGPHLVKGGAVHRKEAPRVPEAVPVGEETQ